MMRILKNAVLYVLLGVFGLVSCNEKVVETYDVDVLVVGGGASGISAGIQSARMGVQTMIVEETPWVGGMLTAAGVSCVDGNYRLQSGIFGEFADSLAQRYGGWEALKTGWVSHINFEPHVGQEVLTNIADGCEKLEIIREAAMISVEGVDGDWTVIFEGKDDKKFAVNADVLIDGTELGDVAKACGVEYKIGMEASSDTGESIAPEQPNDVIQDLTFVTILKDYGKDADMTIAKPEGYDPTPFYNCAVNPNNVILDNGKTETGQSIWSPDMMITYGQTPNGKFMINWPIYGNDYYINSIEMTPAERKDAYKKAKNFTLSFIYFIQTELGMKHLGLADDEFPTEDKLAFIPYHRESRRIVGKAFFTIDAAAAPYDFKHAYYRTGIAVGDYAVDHHHFRHPDWKNLPDLHFYPIPSYNMPMGVLVPKQDDVKDLLVAEKSVSVSNLINGATRLQPVVMQLGQAAGTIAALSQLQGKSVDKVDIRQVQAALLDAGCYIMPYLDLPKDHKHFKAVQRIGATGILRGEGRNVGWANQTWFRTDDPLKAEEIFHKDFYPGELGLGKGVVTVGQLVNTFRRLGVPVPDNAAAWWAQHGLENYKPKRVATRLEAAVLIDALFNPFENFRVDYEGNIIR